MVKPVCFFASFCGDGGKSELVRATSMRSGMGWLQAESKARRAGIFST